MNNSKTKVVGMSYNYQTNFSSNSESEQKYKKAGIGRKIGGFLAGSLVGGFAVAPPIEFLNTKIWKSINNLNQLNDDEFKQLSTNADKIVDTEGLREKGVSIIRATENNKSKINRIIEIEMSEKLKFLPKTIKKIMIEASVLQNYLTLKTGSNAFYTFKTKKILLPENNLSLSTFHEIGHAANANLSTVGKILQKSRWLKHLSLPLAILAFKPPKAPNEKPKNTFDKVTDFLKNNAGKLTFLSFAPILIEEGMASLKGNAFAKKVLTPELAAKVSKHNNLAYLTYVGLVAFTAMSTVIGAKVSDYITKPKPITAK